jgi:hypothetical protein
MTILFLHGWQSVPGGVKPTCLAQHGHEVINPKLPDEDFEAAVRIAQAEYDRHQPDVVVGFSRGGAVAMNLGSGDTPLVLLCPAWKKYGTVKTLKPGTTILHSRADNVVPFADSEELVRTSGLPATALVEVGSDHRLADPEPLAAMLRACLNSCVPDWTVPSTKSWQLFSGKSVQESALREREKIPRVTHARAEKPRNLRPGRRLLRRWGRPAVRMNGKALGTLPPDSGRKSTPGRN